MQVKYAKHISTGTADEHFPKPTLPEYAVIGRSNVGKSSLINMLSNHGKLARVSKTPGKTIAINHFLFNDNWYLADMPGYGYAKRAKTMRASWEGMSETYFKTRKNLVCVLALIDVRIPPQAIDIDFVNALGKWQVPFVLVFTKCDKMSHLQVLNSIKIFEKEMRKFWSAMPEVFISSSVSHSGKDEILFFIDSCNKAYNNQIKE